MTYKFLVSGKVQGVWYRKFVSERANKKGFKGYVRNLDDGKVEAVSNIENNEKLNEFIEILKEGSPYSVVENINIYEIPEVKFNTFEIKY